MTGSGVSSKEKHAVLGPSSAERWLTCPASIRMGLEVPTAPESPYALEGTCFHALGELEVRKAIGVITPAQHTREHNAWREQWAWLLTEAIEEEMAGYAEQYVILILNKAQHYPDTQVLLEQRVATGVPSCWGTGDCILVSPQHVEVVDIKYGSGVWVDVAGNPQLRLYGVGGLETFGDVLGDTKIVTMTVFQPRMDNTSSESMKPKKLREWRDSLIPLAELALSDDAPFHPSEAACRWCPASGQCRAQLEWATALDFGSDPDLLSPAELAEAMERIPSMLQWAEAVKAVSLDLAYSRDTHVPGYKVVKSGGIRKIVDQTGATDALLAEGHDLDEVSTRKLKGIGELEKLLGKIKFAEVVGPFIKKTDGSPSLVLDSDNRPAIEPNTEAQKEFDQ